MMEEGNIENFPDFQSVTGKFTKVQKRKRHKEFANTDFSDASCGSSQHDTVTAPAKGDQSKNPFKSSKRIRPSVGATERAGGSLPPLSTAAQDDCRNMVLSADSSPSISVTCGGHQQVSSPSAHTCTALEDIHNVIPSSPERTNTDPCVIPRTPPSERSTRRRIPEYTTTVTTAATRSSLSEESLNAPGGRPVSSDRSKATSSDGPEDTPTTDYSLYQRISLSFKRTLVSLMESSNDIESRGLLSFISNTQPQAASPQLYFHRHLHYYAYPNLPWLTLFPRKAAERKNDDSIPRCAYSALHTEWRAALRSALDNLLGSSLSCGYFYVLCEKFNVLFTRCDDCLAVSSIITPTSRGFRRSLEENGISYSMPHEPPDGADEKVQGEHSSRGSAGQTLNTSMDESEDPIHWLEGIGIDRAEFPSLRETKTHMEDEGFRRVDYLPVSTVLVCGKVHLRKLGDLIAESATSTTGQLAHVPPTMLSRSPFLHASIQKLTSKVGHLAIETNTEDCYLNLQGPILPGVTRDLINDVFRGQGASSQSVFDRCVTVDNTAAFNVPDPCGRGCQMVQSYTI